jgi:hypothetical protein
MSGAPGKEYNFFLKMLTLRNKEKEIKKLFAECSGLALGRKNKLF